MTGFAARRDLLTRDHAIHDTLGTPVNVTMIMTRVTIGSSSRPAAALEAAGILARGKSQLKAGALASRVSPARFAALRPPSCGAGIGTAGPINSVRWMPLSIRRPRYPFGQGDSQTAADRFSEFIRPHRAFASQMRQNCSGSPRYLAVTLSSRSPWPLHVPEEARSDPAAAESVVARR